MNSKNFPAFPFTADCDETNPNKILNTGITIRDYFAAFAMQAFISRGYMQDDATRRAYKVADSMIEERKKQ